MRDASRPLDKAQPKRLPLATGQLIANHAAAKRGGNLLHVLSISVAQPAHPITLGIQDVKLREEFYYQLKFVKAGDNFQPVLTADIEGSSETVAWAWRRGDGGRSFGFSGGHFHENWQHPEYRRLMAQAVLWTLQIPIPENGLDVEVDPAVFQLD